MEITQECSKMMVWKIFVIFELYVGALSTQSQKCRFFKMQPFWVTHALPCIENKYWRSFKNSILETSFFFFLYGNNIYMYKNWPSCWVYIQKVFSRNLWALLWTLFLWTNLSFLFLFSTIVKAHFIWNWEKWIKR